MRTPRSAFLSLAVIVAAYPLKGAETGDFDGDGVLTIRDVRHVMLPSNNDPIPDPDVEFAEGSLEAFQEYPCSSYYSEFRPTWPRRELWPASVYLEILRRSVPDGLESYSPMHWGDEWADARPQAPLSPDPRFSVRVLTVEHDSTFDLDQVRLDLEVSITAPVKAFSLILETDDGLMRAPWLYPELTQAPFDVTGWAGTKQLFSRDEHHCDGDFCVNVPVVGYLITKGRYVVTHGLRRVNQRMEPLDEWLDLLVIPPGNYRIVTRGRLPLGTEAGEYRLDLLATSQVLFDDGTVASPDIVEQGGIHVLEDVETGWDEGVPPLRLDWVNRRVLGEVRFRFADEDGNPVEPGERILRGAPGDQVKVRVQMRTETPLNYIHFKVFTPLNSVFCGDETRSILVSPDGANEPATMERPLVLACNPFLGTLEGWYHIGCNHGGGDYFPDLNAMAAATNHRERPWEYFKPLGEWLDLMEFDLQISEVAEGDIPLVFERPDPSDPAEAAGANQGSVEFAPYIQRQFCFDHRNDESLPSPHWQYDVVYEDGFIAVDDTEPPPRPDLGIEFELGEAEGVPGDLVEVPVLLSWLEPVAMVRLAVETDPEDLVIETVDTSVIARRASDNDIRNVWVPASRGEVGSYSDCLPNCGGGPDECCWFGEQASIFHDTAVRYTVIDWLGFYGRVNANPLEIARLRVRIQEGGDVNLASIRPAVVELVLDPDENPIPTTIESGGISDELQFSPAIVKPGTVRLLGDGRDFKRGDSTDDGLVNLTDAIRTLSYLFRDADAPPCPDAADTDDNGVLQLTDAVFGLRALFVAGAAPIPPPFPDCGVDPTADNLRCEEGVCRAE